MTGKQRTIHKNWLQQRQQVDENRMRRQKKEDGRWKREWDVEKPEKNRRNGNRNNYGNEYENNNRRNVINQRPKRTNFREKKDSNSGDSMNQQEKVLEKEIRNLDINETEKNFDEFIDAEEAEKEWREQLEEMAEKNKQNASKVNVEDEKDKNIHEDLELKNTEDLINNNPDEQINLETQNEEQTVPTESVNSDLADKNTESFKLIVAKTLDSESNRNYGENLENSETKKDSNESSDSKKDEGSNENEVLAESEISLYAPESFDDNSSDQKVETNKDDDEKESKVEEDQEEDLNKNENPTDETLNNSDLVSDEEFYDVAEEKVSPDCGEQVTTTEDDITPTTAENVESRS